MIFFMDVPGQNHHKNSETGRHIPGGRAVQVVLRSLHIVAMALLLGGLARGGTFDTLRTPIFLTLSSGVLLLLVDLARGGLVLSQGSGVATLFKLVLLGLGNLIPTLRLQFYLAATFVASVGSHMPGNWRHFSLVTWKVAEKQGKT